MRPVSFSQLSDFPEHYNNEYICGTVDEFSAALTVATVSQTGKPDIRLEKLNTILDIDPESPTMLVESGVILENLQTTLLRYYLTTPSGNGIISSDTVG